MTTKTWIIFVAACAALFGGLFYLSNSNAVDVGNIDAALVQPASEQSGNIADHTYGKADSKIVLIEYGDFQCPGCGAAHPVMRQVKETYKDQIVFVFRNFPLTSIHPNARAAAAAAESAGLQDKYWEMHDLLFENQSDWSSDSSSIRIDKFVAYAQTAGVGDINKFRDDLSSTLIGRKIAFDQALGKKVEVSSTPTFFLGNKLIDQYVKDGKLVSKDVEGAAAVWNDAATFGKFVIEPALKEAGIELPK